MQGQLAYVQAPYLKARLSKSRVPDVVLRHGCAAVWVYCGDKEKCLGSYKECWLKHLVRGLPSDGRTEATDYSNNTMSLPASLQRQS